MAGFFGMLTNLRNKIAALEKFDFKAELVSIVTDNKDKLADLQATQLAKGINSKGERIYPLYAAFTIEEKKRKGQEYRWVTYSDTFELYRTLAAQIQGSKFRIKSPSFKFDKMIKRSGADTVGLNLDSRRDFVQEVTRPGILEAYKRKVKDV